MTISVNFMGREACLTNGIKNATKATEFFAPREPIGNLTNVVSETEKLAKEEVAKLNEAYKAAHAPYITPKQPTEAEIYGNDYRAAHGMPQD